MKDNCYENNNNYKNLIYLTPTHKYAKKICTRNCLKISLYRKITHHLITSFKIVDIHFLQQLKNFKA